jgi:hypothetical protein
MMKRVDRIFDAGFLGLTGLAGLALFNHTNP